MLRRWATFLVTVGALLVFLGFQALLTFGASSRARAGAASRAGDVARPTERAGRAGHPGPDARRPASAPLATAASPDEPLPRPAEPGTPSSTAAPPPTSTAAAGAAGRTVPPIPAPAPTRVPATPPAPALAAATPGRPAAAPPPAPPSPPPDPGWQALDQAYRLQRAGDLPAAARAYDRALALGYRPQRTELERAGVAAALGDRRTQRRLLAAAADGPDGRLAASARAALRDAWLDASWRRRAAGDLRGARAALESARAAGADPQRLGVELAYLDLAGGATGEARDLLAAAAVGPDPVLAGRARAQLAALPQSLRFDFYSETFAWDRRAGAELGGAVVPTFRLRARWRPWLDRPLDLYAVVQGTREAGPIAVRSGVPVLHADDSVLTGGGVLLQSRDGKVGVFAQLGTALAVAPTRTGQVALDARAGAFLDESVGRCWPAPAAGVRRALDPCGEAYGQVVYTSRFHHDVFGLARVRAGATLLVAGPVALGVVSEARLALSRNRDWYDQLADVGAGLRARLVAPFHLDLSATAVAGRYLGLSSVDPPPPRLSYVDVRVQAATYVEF